MYDLRVFCFLKAVEEEINKGLFMNTIVYTTRVLQSITVNFAFQYRFGD